MPPNRIDEHGVRHTAHSWESLVERQIREAMDEGKFADLPHQGEPLPKDDDAFAGDWAMAYRMLKNAGAAPPWIEADKEVRALLDRRDVLLGRVASASGSAPPSAMARSRDHAELERLVIAINAAIARLNAEAPTYRQQRAPMSLDDDRARLDALHGR